MLRALRGCNENIALPAKAAANLDGAQIQAYLRHAYSERRPYHPWLSIWRYFADWHGTFLDVGANVGHTIASLAIYNTRTRIWAVEPNALCPECLAFAADLVPNGVTVFLGALGDTDGELPLYLPVVRDRKGFTPGSNASLRRTEFAKRHVIERLVTDTLGPDSLSVLALPSVIRTPPSVEEDEPDDLRIVKIDVEGLERKVLEGLTPLIRKHRSVMTVERNNWPEIGEWLRRENYAAFNDDETGALSRVPDGPAGGTSVDPLVLPPDRLDEVLAKAAGLRLAPGR